VISISEIREFLDPYKVPLDVQAIEKVCTYLSLLLMWNKKMSLTALEDPREIIQIHFGESLAALNLGPITGRLADVGTGAGFPGLPLKLISPSIHVTLIEPNQKKCAFLHEVVRALDLSDVEIFRGRFEDYLLPPVTNPPRPSEHVNPDPDTCSSTSASRGAKSQTPTNTVTPDMGAHNAASSPAAMNLGGSAETVNPDMVLFSACPSSAYFHIITSRALSRTPALLSFCSRALLPSGRLLLWLTPSDIPSLPSTWRLSHPPLALPLSQDRLILTAYPSLAHTRPPSTSKIVSR
jgi:16S rRNA G527 N7-methylase RsmG